MDACAASRLAEQRSAVASAWQWPRAQRLAVAGALSGLMRTGPLFIWISISYLIVLLIDTVWLVQQSKSDLDQTST